MAAADAARQAWEQNRRDVDMDMEMEIDEESKPGLRRTNHVRIRRPRNSTTDIDAHILQTLVRNAVVYSKTPLSIQQPCQVVQNL
jgi:hypothetical protein